MSITRGILAAIISGSSTVAEFVLRVDEVKEMPSVQGKPSRFKLALSDDSESVMGILSTQLNSYATDGSLFANCLIRITSHQLQMIGPAQVLVVLEAEPLGEAQGIPNRPPLHGQGYSAQPETNREPFPNSHAGQLSSPIPAYGSAPAPTNAGIAYRGVQSSFGPPAYGSASTPVEARAAGPPSYGSRAAPMPSYQSKAVVRDEAPVAFTPIHAINPYTNRWTIKARITGKTELKSWNNAKGSGTLFSITLLDSSGGEIRATFFKDAATKFFDQLSEGNVYTFSGGKLKVNTNQQYSTVKNNYELTFDTSSNIAHCKDDEDIKSAVYNFVKIQEIGSRDVNTVVDVLGVIKNVGDLVEINSAKLSKILKKRDITIVDDSNVEVRVTFWDNKAMEDWAQHQGRVAAFKCFKIGDYQGKFLATTGVSTTEVEPNIPEGLELHTWYSQTGYALTANTISGAGFVDSRGPETLEKRKTISYLKGEGIGAADKGEYLTLKAHVNMVMHEKDPWYTACPKEGCNKKVTYSQGQWRCEKCNADYPECNYRYILSLTMLDHTGNNWFSAFNDESEKMLGVPAQVLHQLKESGNTDDYNAHFTKLQFKEFIIKIRAKMEAMDDQQRLKCTILQANPVDHVAECSQLLDAIAKYD